MNELKDLLELDTEKNNAAENKKILRQIKQILKKQSISDTNSDIKADTLPYEAISVVGNKAITLKFDLETKEAIVSDVYEDSRDTGHKNYMAVYYATNELARIGKEQR